MRNTLRRQVPESERETDCKRRSDVEFAGNLEGSRPERLTSGRFLENGGRVLHQLDQFVRQRQTDTRTFMTAARRFDPMKAFKNLIKLIFSYTAWIELCKCNTCL